MKSKGGQNWISFTPPEGSNIPCLNTPYGGVYIVAAIVWLWAVEGHRPDRWDLTGGIVCLIGAGIILLGPCS